MSEPYARLLNHISGIPLPFNAGFRLIGPVDDAIVKVPPGDVLGFDAEAPCASVTNDAVAPIKDKTTNTLVGRFNHLARYFIRYFPLISLGFSLTGLARSPTLLITTQPGSSVQCPRRICSMPSDTLRGVVDRK